LYQNAVIKVPLDVLTHCICIWILVSANTLENVYKNMLTHIHKVKHLAVGTFEQGWRSCEVKVVIVTKNSEQTQPSG
jgi:hypothetical protein